MNCLKNTNADNFISYLTSLSLISQGFCTPPELTQSDEAGEGTEFVDIEAGGFDDGEGTKNVSKDAERDNLVSVGHTQPVYCWSHGLHVTGWGRSSTRVRQQAGAEGRRRCCRDEGGF